MHTAKETQRRFQDGEISAQDIIKVCLERIEQQDGKVGAFLSLAKERAYKRAVELDKKRKEGKPLGKLAGVPIAIKDNIHIEGELTTCASKFLTNYRAPFSATVVESLEKEDALIVGKTNLDEFAMGSSTETSAFKLTKNPWDLACTPGGSSGGSAAAVAARFVPIAFGSDTGGSIRQPASLTGVVGFKPSYGRVSRYGLVAFGSSLDQIGPFATRVEDVALTMNVVAHHCHKDSTSVTKAPEDYAALLGSPFRGCKIGVPWNFMADLAGDAKDNFLASLEILKKLHCEIVDVDLEILKTSIAVYYILATAEASTNLARFDGIRYGARSLKAKTLDEVYDLSKQEGFGPEVKNRILLGTYVLSSGYQDAYYRHAQKVRTLIIRQFAEAFKQCTAIAMPVSPFPAFPLGSIQDPLQMYLQDIYTIAANLAGLPAISVPSGFNQEGKPWGLQLLGPQLQDGNVLHIAHAFEQVTQYSHQLPPLFAS
ncbi:MAG: Asp-tRNA(Asn)/Glu-tRNA(Gln) amidotransferase subunit GatA [Simkania sp.]|nr:Asp-tRNA(Asn)/Glu-tRNA(Gln) amidotransferase subunit GatA [Simkania sp.]